MNFDFLKLLKNTKKIQQMVEEKQKEFEKITVVGEAGAGSVKITANMRHYIQSLDISDDIFEEASSTAELKEILSELFIAAHNQLTQKIEQFTKEKMFNMGGFNDLFGGSDGDDGSGGNNADILNTILNPSQDDEPDKK